MTIIQDGVSFQAATVPPDTDLDTAWWWAKLGEGELMMPRCRPAGHVFFPPSPGCPVCGVADIEHVSVSGAGEIYSYIVIHRALDPAYTTEVPYTVVAVTLDEGARVFGRIANGEVQVGDRVQAVVYRVDDVTLLGFEQV